MSEHGGGIDMRKGTPEQIAQRREEIINACEQLYQTTSFREITLKEIGKITSFSRPTIYNYFETKEEIFLALFKREYDRWNEQLTEILNENDRLTKEELSDKIAQSLADRPQLLKLLAMNNYDMEENSRQELLTSFKVAYGESMRNIRRILEKFCPEMSVEEIQSFVYVFFPFHLTEFRQQIIRFRVMDVQRILVSVFQNHGRFFIAAKPQQISTGNPPPASFTAVSIAHHLFLLYPYLPSYCIGEEKTPDSQESSNSFFTLPAKISGHTESQRERSV